MRVVAAGAFEGRVFTPEKYANHVNQSFLYLIKNLNKGYIENGLLA
jgi:hypothetical protein